MSFHSLVNTRYFSEAAIGWKKNSGRYVTAPQGSRDYYQYWDEQDERCRYGYKVADLWIPGRMYFYLNFFPMSRVPQELMMRVLSERDKRGKISVTSAEKVISFPSFWEVHYEWWNLKHIAWSGGNFMGIESPGGKHMSCLKTRGAGFSYLEACDGVYNYNFIDGSKNYYFASAENYLIGDAIMDKVQSGLDWLNAYSPYWKKNRQKKFTLMHQKASYIDSYGVEKGSMSEIIAQIVDKPGKAHPYSANIVTPNGLQKWEDIQEGSRIFGADGKIITVEKTFELGEQDIYTMELNDGRKVDSTIDHLWNITKWHERQKNKQGYSFLLEETITTEEIMRRLSLKNAATNPYRLKLSGCTDYPYYKVPVDAYTLGVLLGDGSIKRATKNITPLTMMHEDVDAIKHLIPYKVKRCNWGTGIRNSIYIPNGKELFTQLELINKTAGDKFIPDQYKYNSKEVRLAVINGLLDTDGSCTKDFGVIEYSTKSEQLAKDFIWIIHSLGYGGTVKSRFIKGTRYFRCYIYAPADTQELFNLPRKRELVSRRKSNAKATNITLYATIKSIKFSHREKAKCIQVDAEDALYLIEDHIITHNTRGKRGRKITFEEAGSFPNLEAVVEVSLGSIREGSIYVGQMSIFGTGGEVGPSIQGLENIHNNPEVWDMLPFDNVWDEGYEATTCGYFVPCWRANAWYMDNEGNVDMDGAIAADDIERKKKELSKNPKDLDRRKAEYPRTPSEALQRITGNEFNQGAIEAQIKRINGSRDLQALIRYGFYHNEPEIGPVFTVKSKRVAQPIDFYPHRKGDNLKGCCSMLEKPYTDEHGKVPAGLYTITFDPYAKQDAEDVTSLWSFKVWKNDNNYSQTFINLPVLWYAGRPMRYEDNHDIMFMAAEDYNAEIQGEIAGGGQSVVTHAKTLRKLQRIKHEPEMMHNKEIASKSAGNSYLMNMAGDRKPLGLKYLVDWHNAPIGVDSNGKIISRISRVYDIAWLQEMLKHNQDGNFDRISDAIIFMFEMKENYANMVRRNRQEKKDFYDRVLFDEGGDGDSQELTGMY